MRFDEIIEWERAEERVETQVEVLTQILEQHGKIPDKLRESIINEKDTEVLDKMLKVAITAKNIEQFEEKMGIVKRQGTLILSNIGIAATALKSQ